MTEKYFKPLCPVLHAPGDQLRRKKELEPPSDLFYCLTTHEMILYNNII